MSVGDDHARFASCVSCRNARGSEGLFDLRMRRFSVAYAGSVAGGGLDVVSLGGGVDLGFSFSGGSGQRDRGGGGTVAADADVLACLPMCAPG